MLCTKENAVDDGCLPSWPGGNFVRVLTLFGHLSWAYSELSDSVVPLVL